MRDALFLEIIFIPLKLPITNQIYYLEKTKYTKHLFRHQPSVRTNRHQHAKSRH